ncbi:hypothetical protein CbK_gp206 [Caulobacter phage phiCbK]|uniref:Uncharacterized protein n=5 Tax=Viruses TaxID=10239 RepID=K4JTF9_9CAUD|nr:hypothetical protein D865_gp212 [Caulobacter phage phiCbK]AFU87038.1 hypothetical protein CbK_gp206 [Caulobacter phage phiCbK]
MTMPDHSPKLGMMLGFFWHGLWCAVALVFLLSLYALVIFPVGYVLARLRRLAFGAIPNFDLDGGFFRLRYHRRRDPLADGWNLDIDITLLGGGFSWRSIEWQGFKRFDLGWLWLIRFVAGGMDAIPGSFGRHAYVSLGLLGLSLDIGTLDEEFRIRLFFNGRRLFYRHRLALT